MAEFALGLTKMAVEGTVSRVKLAIEEEGKLRVRVENDLVFITGEFQMMQAFLKMANVKGAKNEVVRTWLRQVRDLAFDVEDCIEFVVHLEKKSPWAWLRRLGRMVVSCNAPPLPLDKAVDDIRRLKARVQDVSQRNTRYNLIGGDDSGSGSNSDAVLMQATPSAAAAAAAFRTLREVWEVNGKWHSTGDLQKLVMGEGQDLQVISIWGNTSTGATDFGAASLFSKMYNDPSITQEFKTHAWVKLMHPFHLDEFLKCLLTQLHACSHQMDIDTDFWRRMRAAVAEEDGLSKTKLMQEVMSKQKYLIVLEEVFSVVEWNVIKMYLPDSENGSRIVLSTRQLEVALVCTGKPYQVSELKHFSDEHCLCAFSKKYGRRSGKGELLWQIRCRGVISVFGDNGITTTLVNKVYTRIVHKWKQFEGVEFERHSWVDVPVPFNLEVLSRRLLLTLCSEDLVYEEIAAIGRLKDPCLTQECCKFLREHDCLVVINGLQSTHDWDSIKAAFLSEPTKGCIVVITNEASVATHCAEEEEGILNMEHMKDDVILRPLVKASEHCERGGVEQDDRPGRPFSVRMEQAREWLRQFGRVFCDEMGTLELCLRTPGVISLWGASAGKSALIRRMYYSMMVASEASWESGYGKQPINLASQLSNRTEKFSWVNVPHPFNLTEFSCSLLLGFHSGDHRSKKTAALSMMEEGQEPIEESCRFLREYQCMVVIDGIQSTHEWDTIEDSFLSKPMKGHIVVITDEATVAMYCVNHQENRVIELKTKTLDGAPSPPVKDCPSHLFSNRRGEARSWTNKYRLLGHQNGSAHLFGRSLSFKGPSVTSVWGIAGIGKSTVIRSMYCHLMLGVEQSLKTEQTYILAWKRPDFTMYSWADVPHPFNLADLSWRLLQDFYSDDLEAKSTAAIGILEGQDPIQECRRFLREHKCLVVIDGLRSKDDWESIKAAFLPDSTKACIVVITNEESVARHCADNKENQLVNVKGLEADNALDLFKERASGGYEFTADAMELAKFILDKCGGIPRVIVTVADMTAEFREIKWDTEFLEKLNDNFMGSLETDTKVLWYLKNTELHSLSLLSWMQSYFDACSDSLKPCIFYLSIFHGGHNVRRRRLLRRWIAESYTRDTSRGTAGDNAEKLISELVEHKTSKVFCQVNGFFHEYIISRPLEDNLVFALEGNCSLNSERAGQHLTIRSNWDRDKTVFTSMDLSRLRSLTVFGKWMPFFISTDMRLLRVLDLEDASGITVDDLEQIGKVHPRLKFLSVRGCKEINRLPESLCGLSQLQTLDARHTSIVMLPPAIAKLKKLQYICNNPEKCNLKFFF